MTDHSPFGDRGQSLRGQPSFRQIYSALQSTEIRILLLSPGSEDDPVEVQLEVIASTRSQQYEALSYVWGPARADHQIECNNVSFRITESLHTALYHLRYKSAWRRLWVDQICIDQNNEDELMSQVTRMGSIYADSSRVIVWLGLKDPTMSKAWKVIEETSLSVSLVRSDFLDSPPVSVEKKARKSSLMESSFDDMRASSIDGSPLRRKSSSNKSSLRSQSSINSMTRPLRTSLNSSNSSLASSTTSLSSNSSSLSSQPPRTPIRKKPANTSVKLRSPNIDSGHSSTLSAVRSSQKPLQPSKLKLALSIFQHVYFTRLWTFQEIVLSPAAIFVSDDLEFALADLMGWYFHYVSKPMFITPCSLGRTKSPRGEGMVYDSVGSFENVMHIRHQMVKAGAFLQTFGPDNSSSSSSSHDIKFSTLLMLTRPLQSLKAEDRVLSLLGLHDGFASYLRNITEVDGWLPVPELFLAAFRYCVQVEQSLDILSAAGVYTGNRREGFEGWPSWLPDWREGYPIRPLILENTKVDSDTETSVEPEKSSVNYQAASHLPMSVKFEEDDYGRFTFKVHGRRLGIVLTKSNSWPDRFFVIDAHTEAGIGAVRRASTEHSQNVCAILRNGHVPAPLPPYAAAVLADAQKHKQVCETLRTAANVVSGDWICSINGGALLYVLRPIDRNARADLEVKNSNSRPVVHGNTIRCRFIGECAVSTFMDGSIVNKVVETQALVEATEFELV